MIHLCHRIAHLCGTLHCMESRRRNECKTAHHLAQPIACPIADVLCRVQFYASANLALLACGMVRVAHDKPRRQRAACLQHPVRQLVVVHNRSWPGPAPPVLKAELYVVTDSLSLSIDLHGVTVVNVLEPGVTFVHPLVHEPEFQFSFVLNTLHHLCMAWRANLVCFPALQQAPFSTPRVVQGFKMSGSSPAVCKRI